MIQEIARIAERGKFDLLFVSDGLDYEQGDLPSFMCRFEPTSLISVLSAHTTRLGLGATVSTSFTEPYNLLRRLRHGESSGWYDAGLARHVAPDGVAPTDAPLEPFLLHALLFCGNEIQKRVAGDVD